MKTSAVVFSIVAEDDDCLLLALQQRQRRKIARSIKLKIFSLEDYRDDQFEFNFRFNKSELERLKAALHIPEKIVCKNGTICMGLEGNSIICYILTYDNICVFCKNCF
jgi:hypothetical protein